MFFWDFLIPGITTTLLFAVKRVFYFLCKLDWLICWLSMSCPFQALSVKTILWPRFWQRRTCCRHRYAGCCGFGSLLTWWHKWSLVLLRSGVSRFQTWTASHMRRLISRGHDVRSCMSHLSLAVRPELSLAWDIRGLCITKKPGNFWPGILVIHHEAVCVQVEVCIPWIKKSK